MRMKYDETGREQRQDDQAASQEAQALANLLRQMRAQDAGEAGRAPARRSEEGRTVDLIELFFYILTKLHFVLLSALICAILAGMYASSNTVPIYSATSKLYIIGQSGTSIIADLQIGSYLTMDYQEVFRTWEVHQMVNDALGTDYSYSMLQGMVSVENPEDTAVLYITARHPDAQMAADMANAYADAAKRFITETMGTDEPSTFSVALVPSVASSTSVTSYVIRGILLGTVLAGGVLVVLFLLDNRPKSPDDIMQAAGIPTLAVLPKNPNLSGDRAHRKKARRA